ncbi:hypothetical protein FACS1894141_6370 [Spirochaetia bacterium]|nr:hypothetical protein FACS1894141_6370 [Spirochaetia bacterium]
MGNGLGNRLGKRMGNGLSENQQKLESYRNAAMKRYLCLITIAIAVLSAAFSQEQQIPALDETALLALSNPDYQVTAGDVYSLTYAAAGKAVSYRIIVDSTYRIQVSNLGLINAAGKTYLQLKNEVEALVSKNYPLSGVQLVLTQPAAFLVYITGEVDTFTVRSAWALARLSTLLEDGLTAYASIRDITITASSGQSKTYDLFQAQRYGDVTQDPYLRPGDTITINRIDRVVSITGSVERPGTYQLLPGENLSDLITKYASGLIPTADTGKVELVRHVGSETDSGDKLFLSEQDIANNYRLNHLDAVTVPSITDLIPVMFVEGAVNSPGVAQTNPSTRLTVQFTQGENYASLLKRNESWFTAISDTQNAYIIRGNEQIPLNINPMLYDSAYQSPYLVERNDVLIIPFRQYFVSVAGAVAVPGRYPYIPDRGWDYYIALAGGFTIGMNAFDSVIIKDITGKKMKKTDPITPETVITAKANSWLFYFNQYAPVITTVLTIITSFFTVSALLGLSQ